MKEIVAKLIAKSAGLQDSNIISSIEVPPNPTLGDFAFPCFSLAKELKKNPMQIAQELAKNIKLPSEFEKVEAKGPYINFFLNKTSFAADVLKEILKKKDKFGYRDMGKKKVVAIDMSAPNIAKPFGIGHLRSTIIGESLSRICQSQGFKTVKINYLGDWGTQFGILIAGYKKWGDAKKLEKEPIAHLLDLYVKANKDPELEQEGRDWFKKLEDGNSEALALWKKFRSYSLKEFEKVYSILGSSFDVISGESVYNNKMDGTVKELEQKGLLKASEGAQVVDLEEYGLGVCLIKKSDGASLYATRDITAAIDRHKKYKFERMIYEVGSEQSLHFKQFFKVLELMGYSWAKNCVHVNHGLYLGKDGKKFSTRQGKNVFMLDVLNETIDLAKKEIAKREKLPAKELEKRAKLIALSAILYGDLKNYRSNDIVFDIERFLSFEGDTGPYLLYSYARARSILQKAKYKSSKPKTKDVNEKEKLLINELNNFPEVVAHAYSSLAPNLVANYAFQLSQTFNEFYHANQVIGSEQEQFRLVLVDCFSQVLKNALYLLGINVLERM